MTVLNLHATSVGHTDRYEVISGRYDKCHSIQLQTHYDTHVAFLHKRNYAELVVGNYHGIRGIVCWP